MTLQHFSEEMIHSVSDIPLLIHILIGFSIGGFIGWLTEGAGGELIVTFLLGFAGAAGAGLFKIIADKLKKMMKKEGSQNDED